MIDVNIKNSRLRFRQLDWIKGEKEITVDKSKLHFQAIYFYQENSNMFYRLSLCGKDCFNTESIAGSLVSSAFVLENRETTDFRDYTTEERNLLYVLFLTEFFSNRLNTAELVCHSLEDGELLRLFYETYNNIYSSLKCYISDVLSNKVTIERPKKKYSLIYQRSRYSVCDLLDDLINDKSYIYTDSDLIEDYSRISRPIKDGSKFVPEMWSAIVGKQGNRTRANLSILYSGIVSIDIPENKFGIKTGPRELKATRSICIVKDGIVWTPKIGVRINSERLIKKLKACGVIEKRLVFKNEFLLNLSNLPVISKSKLRRVVKFDIAKAEANVFMDGIAIAYLSYLKYLEDKKLKALPEKIKEEDTPEEKFLHSLGVYGDHYYPGFTETDKITGSYEALEIIGNISQVPNDYSKNLRSFINTGNCRSVVIREYLKKVIKPEVDNPKTSISDLLEVWKNKKNRDINKLRDLKFRLILKKDLKIITEPMEISVTDSEKIKVSWSVKNTTVSI